MDFLLHPGASLDPGFPLCVLPPSLRRGHSHTPPWGAVEEAAVP